MGGIRDKFAEMIASAAGAGICSVREGWHMTPAEMMAMTDAMMRRRLDEMRDMDALAWLVGQYAAVGINAPARYPSRPDRVRERAAGDREMQRMMAGMAREII